MKEGDRIIYEYMKNRSTHQKLGTFLRWIEVDGRRTETAVVQLEGNKNLSRIPGRLIKTI